MHCMRMVGATAAAVIVVALVGTPPAHAAAQITVTPSPNGLVMIDVPTVITPSGFTGRAKVLRYDEGSRMWLYMGATTAGRPITYTFARQGRVKVKVVPKGQKAASMIVPVYARFVTTTDPTTFGDVQLPNGRPVSAFDPPWTAPASAGCDRLDIGMQALAQAGSTATEKDVYSLSLLVVPVRGSCPTLPMAVKF